MKLFSIALLILFSSCTDKKSTAIDAAIRAKEDKKGVTLKSYEVISEKKAGNYLTVYYSAKVVEPVSLSEILHQDSIELLVIENGGVRYKEIK